MSSDRDKERRLDELVGLLRDENLSETQAQELRELLDKYPPAMNRLAEHMVMAASLKTLLEHSAYENQPILRRYNFSKLIRWEWAAAIAASFISVVVLTFIYITWQQEAAKKIVDATPIDLPAETPIDLPAEAVAMLTRSRGAVWDSGTDMHIGTQLVPGRYKLMSGEVQFEFFGGAAVVQRGPTDLEIISVNRAMLHSGNLTATVPPQALGFTIITHDFEIIDMGTAFGVEIESDGVEVHVLDGKVMVQDRKKPSETKLVLHTGEAVKAGPSGISPTTFRQERFKIDAAAIDAKNQERDAKQFERWKTMADRLKKSSDTLLYFDLQDFDPNLRTVHHATAHATPDGIAVGCTPTQGRWLGKNALRFSNLGDRVRVNLPGEFETLTLMMSIRFDGFPRPGGLTSLFFCDANTENRCHWQFWRNGRIGLGIRGQPHYTTSQPGFDPNEIERWLQLAVVYDGPQKQVRHYVDGRLAEAIPTQADIPVTVGFAEIGNWNWRSATNLNQRRQVDAEPRAFYGLIDEFCVLGRALNDDEMQEIYAAGQPASP